MLTELQEEGAVLVSQVQRHGGRGRPAEVLCAHPGAVRYIGVDYSHTRVVACIANSTGQVIAKDSVTYSRDDGWEKRCRAGIDMLENTANLPNPSASSSRSTPFRAQLRPRPRPRG